MASIVQSQFEDGLGFVISDSTFPGAGKFGISHVFARTIGSNEDYQQSLVNLINFSLFSIPFVGANIGGYLLQPDISMFTDIRYYDIAVISPISIMSSQTNDHFPYNQEYFLKA
jgi:alpha-glucosidase (family GH31 glycosyl hydrolase)